MNEHKTIVKFLHWGMAIMIVGLFALGMVAEELPRGASREFGMMLHQSIGLVFVALLLVRLATRPAVAAAASAFERLAARAMHSGLYVLMFAAALSGLASQWARGRGIDFFGLVTFVSPVTGSRALGKLFEEVHEAAATGILVLAGLHAAAALRHHYVRRDGRLRAILPGGGRRAA
jgi:cytochrome b561